MENSSEPARLQGVVDRKLKVYGTQICPENSAVYMQVLNCIICVQKSKKEVL